LCYNAFLLIIWEFNLIDNLQLDETTYTPKISLDAQNATLEIVGKSYPENTFKFYKPVMEWIENYFSTNVNEKTVVNLQIEYLNSSSAKVFFDFFSILEEACKKSEIEVNWIYDEENDSALEAGEDYIEDFENLNINLVSKGN